VVAHQLDRVALVRNRASRNSFQVGISTSMKVAANPDRKRGRAMVFRPTARTVTASGQRANETVQSGGWAGACNAEQSSELRCRSLPIPTLALTTRPGDQFVVRRRALAISAGVRYSRGRRVPHSALASALSHFRVLGPLFVCFDKAGFSWGGGPRVSHQTFLGHYLFLKGQREVAHRLSQAGYALVKA
jgi:hypothetical protein